MEKGRPGKLNADEARHRVGQFHDQRRTIRHSVAEKNLTVMAITFAPFRAIARQQHREIRRSRSQVVAVRAIPHAHLGERLDLTEVHLPPRIQIRPGVKTPLAIRNAIAAAGRVIAG